MKRLIKIVLIGGAGAFVLMIAIGVVVTALESPEDKAAREADRAARAVAQAAEEAAAALADSIAAAEEAEAEAARARINCLSNAQAGIHANLNRQIRANLNDPDSYEHVQSQLQPVPAGVDGIFFAETRELKVLFSARNALGKRVRHVATATLRVDDCDYTLTAIE